MHSCIYEGQVRHSRYRPVTHAFRYALYMLYLDLAELELVFRGRWFWSSRHAAWARFRRSDHLGDANVPLDTAVRDLVNESTGRRPAGPIRLLTNLRYAGFAMNPLSLFYCFDRDGQRVETVVAEVNNTPWREQHCYVLQPEHGSQATRLRVGHAKTFHVSPFMSLDQHYRWTLSEPDNRLAVNIKSVEDGAAMFDATMTLVRRPITTTNLTRVLVRYPLTSGQIFAAIYWQALRLWFKNCPFYPHPNSLNKSEVSAS